MNRSSRTVGSVATVLVASLLVAGPSPAADRFVAPTGSDPSNTCSAAAGPCASISHAVDQASSGDTIKVARGTYVDNVRLESTTDLTFLGGFDASFTSREPLATPSVLKAGRPDLPGVKGKDRAWWIRAVDGEMISVTIDGFVLRNGRSGAGLAGEFASPGLEGGGLAGGGVAALAGEDSAIILTIRNTTITKNRDSYGGGGLSLWATDDSSLAATLENVRILKNKSEHGAGGLLAIAPGYAGPGGTVTVRLVNCVVAENLGALEGGGIQVDNLGTLGSTVAVEVVASTVTRNAVRGSPLTPGSLQPGGGGIWAFGGGPVSITLVDTILHGNRLRGTAIGADLFDFQRPGVPPVTGLVVNAEHSDLGDTVIQGGTLNDLGGNVDLDPGLDSAYHLEPDSPLVDAGTCSGAPPTDFDGDPRPTGAGCDIGADEAVP